MLLFMSSLFIFFASWLSFRDCFFDREGRALWRKREVRCKLSSCFLSSGNTELWKWSAGFIWWFYFGLLLHVVPVLFTFSQCSPCILGCSNSSKSTSNEIRCSRRKSMPFGTLLGQILFSFSTKILQHPIFKHKIKICEQKMIKTMMIFCILCLNIKWINGELRGTLVTVK